MELKRQNQLVESFYTWYHSGLANVIADNRRRYRMQMVDEADRSKRGLSALPSTKSASVSDRFREKALLEYHENVDSISYTSKAVNDITKEELCRWLTEIFVYRSQNTFPFFSWHSASLLAGAVDGIEAAMVWWRREATTKNRVVINTLGLPQEMIEPVIVRDTWWIDQLMPGRDVVWDPTVAYMDVNLGQFAMVRMKRSIEEAEGMAKARIFDIPVEWKQYQRKQYEREQDQNTTVAKPDNMDMGDKQLLDIWCFFSKENNTWNCQFSICGKTEISTSRPVNDIFFAGRQVNRLPVVVGVHQQKLWETVGRGLPETIAPIEDEWQDQRNNLNDIAKATAQGGRIRVNPDADVNLDDVLNSRIFHAEQNEVEFVQYNSGIMEAMRASDPLIADMNELLPVGIESRGKAIAPKGTNNTLGAAQMMDQASNSKLGVQLMTRNETFMKPLLWLIAQLEMAFETDETVARIAANKADTMAPYAGSMIDFSRLDFDVDVQINAGMGSVPRFQKYAMIQQLFQLGQVLKLPMDPMKFYRQASILAGYAPETFLNPNPPPPPPPEVEYKCNVDIPIQFLPPEAVNALLQKMMTGQMNVTGKVQSKDLEKMVNESRQNTMPQRADAPMVDATGPAAQGMSQGGQGGY